MGRVCACVCVCVGVHRFFLYRFTKEVWKAEYAHSILRSSRVAFLARRLPVCSPYGRGDNGPHFHALSGHTCVKRFGNSCPSCLLLLDWSTALRQRPHAHFPQQHATRFYHPVFHSNSHPPLEQCFSKPPPDCLQTRYESGPAEKGWQMRAEEH